MLDMKFPFENEYSDQEIIQFRNLLKLFRGTPAQFQQAKTLSSQLDKPVVARFIQYKKAAETYQNGLDKSIADQDKRTQALKAELHEHQAAIVRLDARLEEIEREERQIIGIGEYAPQHVAARAHAKKTASSATATTTVSSGKTKKANCVLM